MIGLGIVCCIALMILLVVILNRDDNDEKDDGPDDTMHDTTDTFKSWPVPVHEASGSVVDLENVRVRSPVVRALYEDDGKRVSLRSPPRIKWENESEYEDMVV